MKNTLESNLEDMESLKHFSSANKFVFLYYQTLTV